MNTLKKTKILVVRFKEIGDAILSSIICNNLTYEEKYRLMTPDIILKEIKALLKF